MLSVLKIGGSVLRDADGYAGVAAFIDARLDGSPAERLVVIVSAQHGTTDRLLAEAHAIAGTPDAEALDLLWSTGEIRSVALLALHLRARGVASAALNVHQTGLVTGDGAARAGDVLVRPLRLLAALGAARVAVVPGFLAVRPGGAVTSLGRGGSDLTAVLLAAALEADCCELIKDVAGYYTADPRVRPDAAPIHELSIDAALEMAAAGCDLVQAAALEAARRHALPLVVRSLEASAPITHVLPRRANDGVRHQDDSRRAAVGA